MKRRPDRKYTGADTSRLADILPALCRDLALDEKVKELSLLSIWETLLDDAYQGSTRAVGIRRQGTQNILLIRVREAALASQLAFEVEKLKNNLNRFIPQTGVRVDEIRLQVGDIG